MSDRRASSARRSARPRSQHFLRSQSLAADVVRGAGIVFDDLAVDLGAGTGRLTSELARAAGHVVAVELDPRLAGALRRRRWPNVHVVEADAATVALPPAPFRVVANLPFARTNAILRHLLDEPSVALARADVIVEWGVAVKRALPWPSTTSGVLWGARYRFSLERRLGRAAFAPAPAVDAGLLVIERRPTPLVRVELLGDYQRFVTRGFRRGLPAVASRAALRRCGAVGAEARALDAHQWPVLFATMR